MSKVQCCTRPKPDILEASGAFCQFDAGDKQKNERVRLWVCCTSEVHENVESVLIIFTHAAVSVKGRVHCEKLNRTCEIGMARQDSIPEPKEVLRLYLDLEF